MRAHPAIRAIATAMERAGWRVTSLVRENERNHRAGRAVDVAPTPASLKVGPRTALRVIAALYKMKDVLARLGMGPARVIAEVNHLHIDQSPTDSWQVGVRSAPPPGGEFTIMSLNHAQMQQLQNALDEALAGTAPIGGPDEDEVGGLSTIYSDEVGGDDEDGGPSAIVYRKSGNQPKRVASPGMAKRPTQVIAPVAKRLAGRPVVQTPGSVAQAAANQAARAVSPLVLAQLRKEMTPELPYYAFGMGPKLNYKRSSLGVNSFLNPYESMNVANQVAQQRKLDLPNLAFTPTSATNLRLDLDAAIVAAGFAAGLSFTWPFVWIALSVPNLAANLEAPFTITITTPDGTVVSHDAFTPQNAMSYVMAFINGRLTNGAAAFNPQTFNSALVATGTTRIDLTVPATNFGGATNGYTAVGWLPMPGDAATESFVKQLAKA